MLYVVYLEYVYRWPVVPVRVCVGGGGVRGRTGSRYCSGIYFSHRCIDPEFGEIIHIDSVNPLMARP